MDAWLTCRQTCDQSSAGWQTNRGSKLISSPWGRTTTHHSLIFSIRAAWCCTPVHVWQIRSFCVRKLACHLDAAAVRNSSSRAIAWPNPLRKENWSLSYHFGDQDGNGGQHCRWPQCDLADRPVRTSITAGLAKSFLWKWKSEVAWRFTHI